MANMQQEKNYCLTFAVKKQNSKGNNRLLWHSWLCDRVTNIF